MEMQEFLPDALIPERGPDVALQPGQKFRWDIGSERILSEPQSREDTRREHGVSFVGGWLSFVGELIKS